MWLTARLPASAVTATPACVSARRRTGTRARSDHPPSAAEPIASPRRKTASIALNEYTVDPNTSARTRNQTTSNASAAMPLPNDTHSGHEAGEVSAALASPAASMASGAASGAAADAPRSRSHAVVATAPFRATASQVVRLKPK